MSISSFAAPSVAEEIANAGFRQAIAEAAASDTGIAAFYRARDFAPFWTAAESASRRTALLRALAQAPKHGLPASRYDPDDLIALFRDARTQRDAGRAEVAAARMFVSYARDLQSGILVPGEVVPGIKRQVTRPSATQLLTAFETAPSAAGFFRTLAPETPEYARLLREKLRLETVIASGGWGPEVRSGKLSPGRPGPGFLPCATG
nr:hypothetical protein [Rhodovulum sp. P5]